jgi:hypothetical protein
MAAAVALVSCPLCLHPESLTLSDLCASLTSSAYTFACPVCNARTAGMAQLAVHLMGHEREQGRLLSKPERHC